MSTTPSTPPEIGKRTKTLLFGLIPPLLLLAGLLGILIYTLQTSVKSEERFEQNALAEWLLETRIGSSNLPELAREYFAALNQTELEQQPYEKNLQSKLDAMQSHLETVGDLTRLHQQQFPLFISAYRIELEILQGKERKQLLWEAGLPKPAGVPTWKVPILLSNPGDAKPYSATLFLDAQLRAFADRQEEQLRRQVRLRQWLSLLTIAATALAFLWSWLILRSERKREILDYQKQLVLDQKEKERLEEQLKREEAEHQMAEARTKLYSDINILAGAYAHNIKNLLVRPRELLHRCTHEVEVPTGTRKLLEEAHQHLQAVTERAQQILKTVRRDVDKPQLHSLDLVAVTKAVVQTWEETAANQWKLDLKLHCDVATIPMQGDDSLLTQTLENLIFNSRDATYAQRNRLREEARSVNDLRKRQEALLAATAWRGTANVYLKKQQNRITLEVTDNGIGMTDDVKARCMETHFTTKKDNAIHEGDGAGMGLGLAFVKWAMDHHQGQVEIDTQPNQGATMRLVFPLPASAPAPLSS